MQMAERNPGIDSLSVVSPAKQTSRDSGRLAFIIFFFWNVMDAEDSLAVGAVTMTIDPDKFFPRTFWHSVWVMGSNVHSSHHLSCCMLATKFRPAFIVNINLCVTVGKGGNSLLQVGDVKKIIKSRDIVGRKIHDSLKCKPLQVEKK